MVVSQGTPGGVSRCPSTGYIDNFFGKHVFLKNKRLHIFEKNYSCSNIHDWMLYPYVSSKCCISKIKYMFGGFEFFRLKVPQSPLRVENIWKKIRWHSSHDIHLISSWTGTPLIHVKQAYTLIIHMRNATWITREKNKAQTSLDIHV